MCSPGASRKIVLFSMIVFADLLRLNRWAQVGRSSDEHMINEKETTMMNKQDNQQSVIEDLTLSEDQAAELKGGTVDHTIEVHMHVIVNKVNKKESESMNQQENQEPTSQAVEVEDLSVEESAQNEIKGGPRMSCSNNLKQLGLASN